MKTKRNRKDTGSVLLCALGAILIVSLIGAVTLRNATTRLNASTNHVRAWKEALSAAETGGDIAFAEIRKKLYDPSHQWETAAGWINSGTTHTSPEITFGSSNLKARTVVETCYFDNSGVFHLGADPDVTANNWYRVRSKGTAPLPNLKRTGMDDALTNDGSTHFAPIGSTAMQDITARGNGDSLLRKIDFKIDHFIATYGPNGDGVGKTLVAVATPQISRRIEQIVAPVTPFFDAAIKAAGTFYGLGDAGWIDSYDSRNGPYDPTVKDNPASPYYLDSRHGSVEINSAVATIRGSIYGDVSTNGGTVVSSPQHPVYGTIDNNVPFTLEDYSLPAALDPLRGGRFPVNLGAINGTTNLTPTGAGSETTPVYYEASSIGGGLNVQPYSIMVGSPPVPVPQDTYVAIRVMGDISGGSAGITVNPKVHLKVYFYGNMNVKSNKLVNQSPSALNPFAANLQFYGISPPAGTTQTIDLNSGTPSLLAMTFYAPSAVVDWQGNPDFIGTMVCKSFHANGNITWHYDRALNNEREVVGFRIASYVEDTR